ncbi:short-chain dehydrogenase TIC 32, chloroplastic-like [Apium graveolens]|uniref:short-chain dehydrogenase TIC 32, chloroplastic-like n=1 Tax=Apium graveolens TaxID=4045 RepID=UPI003D7B9CD9
MLLLVENSKKKSCKRRPMLELMSWRLISIQWIRNNVGIIPAAKFTFSKDNIEQVFAVNHLGQFLLTNLLLDTMKKTARESQIEGRIINLSSDLHKRGVDKEGIVFDEINDEKSDDSEKCCCWWKTQRRILAKDAQC